MHDTFRGLTFCELRLSHRVSAMHF